MSGRPPVQPFDFLAWIAAAVRSAALPCTASRLRSDGALGFRIAGKEPSWVWWLPAQHCDAAGMQVPGLQGMLLGAVPHVESLARALTPIVADSEAVFVAFGPPADTELLFAVDGHGRPARLDSDEPLQALGNLLQRQIRPGRTLWGTLRAAAFETVSPRVFRVPFVGGNCEVCLEARLLEPGEVRGRAVLGGSVALSVVRDSRSERERGRYEFQVEHLVGFALGRALALGPQLVLDQGAPVVEPPGPAFIAPPEPPPALPPAPPRNLAQELMDLAARHAVAPDLLFRSRNASFLPHTMVLLSPGYAPLVCHGNRECICGIPVVPGTPTQQTLVPWPRDAEDARDVRVTDFDDDAVFHGGEPRLDLALADAARDPRPGPVLVAEMCDYHQLQDNSTGIVARRSEETGREAVRFDIIYYGRQILAAGDNRWRTLLPSLLEVAQDGPRGVALVGFGGREVPATRELSELLEHAGIPVLAALFPYLDATALASLGRVACWVISPWHLVQHGPGEVLDALGVPQLRSAGPYGVAATQRWLREIAAFFGVAPDPVVPPDVQAGLARIRAEAHGKRVCFVIPEGRQAEVASPEFFYGFAPFEFLAELGFDVVLLTAPGEPAAAPLPGVAAIEPRLPGEEVSAALRRLRCRLVYSEHPADPRVLRAGCVPFDVLALEPGYAGALRSGRRLLHLARTPFHDRFRSYLGEAMP